MLLRFLLFTYFFVIQSAIAADNKTFLYNKERNQFHVSTSLQSHNSNIVSQTSETSEESESDFSIISQTITGEYFINDMFSVVGGYYFALVLDIDAEIQGFDLGVQYYPFQNGTSKDVSFMGSSIMTSPEWSPFLYMGASTRDYQFATVSLKFQGIELKAGTYWHLHEEYFLKGSFFYQQHLNNNVRTLTTTGASLGIGMKF